MRFYIKDLNHSVLLNEEDSKRTELEFKNKKPHYKPIGFLIDWDQEQFSTSTLSELEWLDPNAEKQVALAIIEEGRNGSYPHMVPKECIEKLALNRENQTYNSEALRTIVDTIIEDGVKSRLQLGMSTFHISTISENGSGQTVLSLEGPDFAVSKIMSQFGTGMFNKIELPDGVVEIADIRDTEKKEEKDDGAPDNGMGMSANST